MKGMCLALAAGLALTACSEPADDTAAEAAEAPAAAEVASPKKAPPPTPGVPAAPKSPVWAVLPQDGRAEAPATVSDGPDGPGGMVTYQTAMSPDAVVEFHRGHAEAAGLATVSTMTIGEARGYAAAAQDASGSGMQVIASPVAGETGPETSVQLSWTAGG